MHARVEILHAHIRRYCCDVVRAQSSTVVPLCRIPAYQDNVNAISSLYNEMSCLLRAVLYTDSRARCCCQPVAQLIAAPDFWLSFVRLIAQEPTQPGLSTSSAA
jgi:hypothetical protein